METELICIICRKKIFILDVVNEDQEYAIDCKHPICPHCFSLVLRNEYIKRVFKEWEKLIIYEGRKESHFK